jgi:GNAT superfamily N-acetyltransferase
LVATSGNLLNIPGYQVRLLQEEDLAAIQSLMERCADYEQLVTGLPPDPSSAQKILVDLPEGKSRVDKFVIGIYAESTGLVGILDAIRDHPRKNDWWLGLLLLDPDHRNQGLGKQIYWAFEAWAAQCGAQSIYAGVIEGNERAYKFWQGLGFDTVETQSARRFGVLEHAVLVIRRVVG